MNAKTKYRKIKSHLMKISSFKLSKSLLLRILMAVLLFLTLAAWADASAVGSSPDEGYVLISAWCGGHNFTDDILLLRKLRETTEFDGTIQPATPFCVYDPKNVKHHLVPALVADSQPCLSGLGSDYSAACQKELIGKQTSKFFESANNNIYIKSLRSFVGADVEASVVKMRLFNSFLGASLILLAVSLDRRRLSDAFITWLAVIAPVVTYFIASVNTSSWTLVGTTCFVYALIAALKNRGKPKIWIPASLLALFSLWFTNSSRYEGKYMILLLGAAILYSEFAPKNFKLRKKTALIGAAIPPVLYVIYNYFSDVYGRANYLPDDPRYLFIEGIPTTTTNLLLENFLNLPRFILGFFGSWGLGWFEVEMTHTVWLFTLQAFLLTTIFALRKSSKIHQLIFGGMFTIMCIAILYANQQTFVPIGQVIQPRYFLPFFLGLVIITAAYKTVRYPNSLVITVAILATISNSIALRDTIRRYTTGQDVFISKSLNNPIEWWWQFGPQPETVWLTGTLAFAGLFAVLIYERNKEEADAPQSQVPELAN